MIRKGNVWWTRVSSSLALLQELSERVRFLESFVLQMPAQIPWEQDFVRSVQEELAVVDSERAVRILTDDARVSPEDIVLNELCSQAVRDGYFPRETKAVYLATADIPRLAQYNVWVRGIDTPARLQQWRKFVNCYQKAKQGTEQHAAFVLEYQQVSGLPANEVITYRVKAHDCYAFCLELAAALPLEPFMQRYAAELARAISNENPQMCEALFAQQALFVQDTAAAVRAANAQCPQFAIDEQQQHIAIWKIQMMMCFPLLESFRLSFAMQHAHALRGELPVSSSNGEMIEEVEDLELGTLYFLCGKNHTITDTEKYMTLKFCRGLRNTLAHGGELTFEEMQSLSAQITL